MRISFLSFVSMLLGVRTSKPVENFCRNLFEPNRLCLEARSQQNEKNCFSELQFEVSFMLLGLRRGHKEDYVKMGECKVGIGLQESQD